MIVRVTTAGSMLNQLKVYSSAGSRSEDVIRLTPRRIPAEPSPRQETARTRVHHEKTSPRTTPRARSLSSPQKKAATKSKFLGLAQRTLSCAPRVFHGSYRTVKFMALFTPSGEQKPHRLREIASRSVHRKVGRAAGASPLGCNCDFPGSCSRRHRCRDLRIGVHGEGCRFPVESDLGRLG